MVIAVVYVNSHHYCCEFLNYDLSHYFVVVNSFEFCCHVVSYKCCVIYCLLSSIRVLLVTVQPLVYFYVVCVAILRLIIDINL